MNDGPLNHALAREELIRTFQVVYDVDREEASHLCLAVLVVLVTEQTAGGLAKVHVPHAQTSYHVGAEPLKPFIDQLGVHRELYHAMARKNRRDALALIQQKLLEVLVPRA